MEITSLHGTWEGPALVVDTARPGELFIPSHDGHGRQAANQHTWFTRELVSQQPQFKSAPSSCGASASALPRPGGWRMKRLAELKGESREPSAARALDGTRMTPASADTQAT